MNASGKDPENDGPIASNTSKSILTASSLKDIKKLAGNGNRDFDPVDLSKIAAIQTALQDKDIVISGGGYTAEAWEIDRKTRLHKQLQLARKLRAKLEQACDEAKISKINNHNHNDAVPTTPLEQNQKQREHARSIFCKNMEHMRELVSLTEAVMGGYTLESYQEYNELTRNRDEKKDDECSRHGKILQDMTSDLAWECNGNEGENPDTNNAIAMTNQQPGDYSSTTETRTHEEPSISRIDNRQSDKRRHSKSSPQHEAPRAVLSTARSKQRLTSTSNKKRKLEKPSTTIPSHNLLGTYSKVGGSNTATTTSTYTTHNVRQRKCHQCKENSSRFRKCQYWLSTGIKCRKVYCESCLVSVYNVTDFGDAEVEKEWHCFSCLEGERVVRNNQKPSRRGVSR